MEFRNFLWNCTLLMRRWDIVGDFDELDRHFVVLENDLCGNQEHHDRVCPIQYKMSSQIISP